MLPLFEWYYQIDWSATGSMIGGIGTCIAIGFACWIAHKQNEITKQIAEKQIQQTELDQKISLYDKRYEVYQLFSNYIYIGNIFINQKKPLTPELNKMIVEQIYYNNEIDRETITKKIVNLEKTVNDPNKQVVANISKMIGMTSIIADEYNNKKSDFDETYKKLLNIDYTFAENQIRKIKMAEFCYPENISKPIIQYISLIFSPEAYEKHELNRDKILKIFKEIKKNKIYEEMKSLLKLSYEDIKTQK